MKHIDFNRLYLILVLAGLLVHIADAQIVDTLISNVQIKDSIKMEEQKTKLELSLEVLSKAIYAGRNFGVDQSGMNPSIIFSHKSGLNLSVYCYGMTKTHGLIQETDLGISYTWHLSPKFSLTPGYGYIIDNIDSVSFLNNKLDINAGMDLNFISINNYFAFNFGNSNAIYNELTISKYISLFSKGKVAISFSPIFVWVSGTKLALSTIAHGKTSYKKAVGKANSNGKGRGHPGSIITTTSTTDSTNQFKTFSYDFMLPITLTFKNFAFSVIPQYDIPVNVSPEESTLTSNPFYVCGKIAYTIPFSGKRK